MKKIFFLSLFILIVNSSVTLFAQQIIKPDISEKNIPVTGKNIPVPNINSGNNPISDDVCCYRNAATFFAISNSDVQTWTVPAGVTSITVEAWGAGGGGGSHTGGGGGGYISANFSVKANNAVSVAVGAGGRAEGEKSTVSINGISIYGGGGGKASESFEDGYPIPAGGFFGVLLSGSVFRNYTGVAGESGKPTMVTYQQYNPTDFRQVSNTGSGGDAGNSKNTGAIGGQVVSRIPGGGLFDASRPGPARIPGGGGAAQSTSQGAAGMVVIHY